MNNQPARETLVKEIPPSSMNEPPKNEWLRPLLGGIIGAVVGGIVAVLIAGFLLLVVLPMFDKVDWDRYPGLGLILIYPALLVIIIGAVIGARWQALWKLFEKLCKWLFRTV